MNTQPTLSVEHRSFRVQFSTKQYPGMPATTVVDAADDSDQTLRREINKKLGSGVTVDKIVLVMEQ